jgi:hypothetical protein
MQPFTDKKSTSGLIRRHSKKFGQQRAGKYHRLVGKFNYLTITRTVMSYVDNIVSQLFEAPMVSQWEIIRIIWHLKRTLGPGPSYRPNKHLRVEDFIDTNWAGSPSDRRFTTKYYYTFFLFINILFYYYYF